MICSLFVCLFVCLFVVGFLGGLFVLLGCLFLCFVYPSRFDVYVVNTHCFIVLMIFLLLFIVLLRHLSLQALL